MKKHSTINPNLNALHELTKRGIFLGIVLTFVFTAANVYLGLKVGLTFSAAIPAAVISMTALRTMKNSNILENNMVQTQVSAAGALPTIIFCLPAMIMIGYWQKFSFLETLILTACGGCLGVLFTIPLRRALVVHSSLPYPEGIAAAEILKVGNVNSSNKQKSGLKEIISGTIVSGVIAFCTNAFHILSGELSLWLNIGKGITQLTIGYSGALVGAGYLMGIISGLSLLVGTFISWGILVPYFTIAGTPAEGQTIQQFAEICYSNKVRLIGAGAMGLAAVWTLIKLSRSVIDGVKEAFNNSKKNSNNQKIERTDLDMSNRSIVVIFLVMLVGLLIIFHSFISSANLLSTMQTWILVVAGVFIAVLIGFVVASVSAYMAGLVGTSASPISGIGILGVSISSLVVMFICVNFGIFEIPDGEKFATALAIFITTEILAIATVSNDNMQDLKTGFLVAATPKKQQIALVIGCIAGAFVIAPVLNLLYEAYGFTNAMPRPDMNVSNSLPAPQAMLMSIIARGILASEFQWEYVIFGAFIGAINIVIDIILRKKTKSLSLPPLAVGMGIYLPASSNTALVIGAVLGYVIERLRRQKKCSQTEIESGKRRGTLFASGLIVGESLVGVLIAGIITISIASGGNDTPLKLVGENFNQVVEILGFVTFLGMLSFFYKIITSRK